MSDYQPEPCRHGARPIITREPVEVDGGPFPKYLPGRSDVRCACPTPDACWVVEAQRRRAILSP